MSNSHPEASVVIGVDVGGTKIATALVDSRGKILRETRHPTDVSSPQATLDGIAQAIDRAISDGALRRRSRL